MKLYNSRTRKKENFTPRKPQEVTMYVCGITPYDTTHLGHAFTYTAFDLLYRLLTFNKYKVNYTQNVTDIDDDILKKAKQVNRDWIELGQWWTDKFVSDMKTLHNTPPTHYVKATETIPTIIEIIEQLLKNDFAYTKNGNIYFRVKRFEDYGKLSGYAEKEMIQLSKQRGANPDDPNKEFPLDFILWQQSLPDEPSWESPQLPDGKGIPKGRPGWHIECSSIVYKYLYNSIDIHGGGIDLIYPHHESEIAQSETFSDEKPFVNFWLHTGPVRYQGDKMSKSLGNLIMVSDLLKIYIPDDIRCLLLMHHYRSTWEYHEDELKKAQILMKRTKQILKEVPTQKGEDLGKSFAEFIEALSDDLNSPKALDIFFRTADQQQSHPTYATQEIILHMADILGLALE